MNQLPEQSAGARSSDGKLFHLLKYSTEYYSYKVRLRALVNEKG